MLQKVKADFSRLKRPGQPIRGLASCILSQAFMAILAYRFFNMLNQKGWPDFIIRFPIEKMIEICCGISIPASCQIGPGLCIHHFGGIVLHDTVVIGKNATLYQEVTIGLRRDDDNQGPRLGDNAYIGAGAKILGNISIGNNVTIGANSVVLRDIPDNVTVAGIPAKIVKK